MNVAVLQPPSTAGHSLSAAGLVADRLAGAVLVRLAATASALDTDEIARDLYSIVAHKLAAQSWSVALTGLMGSLQAAGYVAQVDGGLYATVGGRAAAAKFLGARKPAAAAWPAVRDGVLVARALGLERETTARLKALAKLDGLRALIVLSAYDLKIRGKPSASRLRAALAVVALERAFGNQIKSGLGEKPGLSAKSGRLLAAQLARKPRDFGTDGRLVAALAAEAVGAQRSDLASLRVAVLRRFVSGGGETEAATAAAKAERKFEASPKAVHEPARAIETRPKVVPARPDPICFARHVQTAARTRAQGWVGNRRTFISHVWEAIRERHAEWALSEIEFKCMLTEAHRAGLLALASADLKSRQNLKELQDSAVTYKNTVWHYVRIED
jgi:hypothetical protein